MQLVQAYKLACMQGSWPVGHRPCWVGESTAGEVHSLRHRTDQAYLVEAPAAFWLLLGQLLWCQQWKVRCSICLAVGHDIIRTAD